MNPIYEKLEKCYQCVREKTDFVPEVAIILGSGFGQFADEFEEVKKISYHEISDISGKRTPNSSTFAPISGESTNIVS